MWNGYNIIMWQKGLDKKQNIQGNIFLIQDLLYYIVQIFCIWLRKADFMLSIVAEVSNVTHGPLDRLNALRRMFWVALFYEIIGI